MKNNQPIALVIGLCSHGLAMSRALHDTGIEVHALEAKSNLPSVKTNSAKVHFISSINNDGLIIDLLNYRKTVDEQRPIVLFPTNDNNVKVLANNIDRLSPHYKISWANCADTVRSLLLKSNIEARCKEVGLHYPKSFVVNSREDIVTAGDYFEFPIIAKPVKPQSGFKTKKCNNANELSLLIDAFHSDLPILLQDWVEGSDKDLYFGALYLKDGEVCTEFVGQKLESYPPAMGQTTAAITCVQDEVLKLTKEFFDGLAMSGPVSLELKRDQRGKYFVIEPTVGRTDFWVGLCVSAGCNLLEAEFHHCLNLPISNYSERKETIWFDSERDITAYPRYIKSVLQGNSSRRNTSFSFLSRKDITPFLYSSVKTLLRLVNTNLTKITKSSSVKKIANDIEIYNSFDVLPSNFKQLLSDVEKENIFLGLNWFENYTLQVVKDSTQLRLFCLNDHDGHALAILPMQIVYEQSAGFKIKKIQSLTNYYSPYFNIIIADELISLTQAYVSFCNYFENHRSFWDIIHIQALEPKGFDSIINGMEHTSLKTQSYHHTINWFEQVNSDYESYYQNLNGRLKNTIKRKIKKLAKADSWHYHIYQDLNDLEQVLIDYQAVYDNSWKSHEPYTGFINGLAKTAASQGWLRLGVLHVDEKPIAVQFWLVANNKAYIYKLAYHKEFRHLSPGTVLTAIMMEHVIDQDKVGVIDFLTGKDDYKRDWLKNSRDLYGLEIFNLRSPIALLKYIKTAISRFIGWPSQL